ncbi:MAG: toll/interleukin-1 receptor domain-containing protein, partial [Coriobacteriales bacterium]|nr:toll/interleukin-1 receptor domain-containing protein [Coriobacteriales bacterium]
MPDKMPKVYEGDQPFIFVSYAHADRDVVLPIIATLVDEGYRVWYDDGIQLATHYPSYIADHVYGCESFVVFVSRKSLESSWCNNETNYALDLEKRMLPIYLENVELTRDLQMRMGHLQAIHWYKHDSYGQFYKKLFEVKILDPCLTPDGERRREEKRLWAGKARAVLDSAEYSRQSYVEALNNLRSITRADEEVESLIEKLEERIAFEDDNRARAINQANSALNAEEPREGSLRVAIEELNSLMDKDEEIEALIGDINDRLTDMETERIRHEQEKKRKAEEKRKAAEERKAEEERLAREKAEHERREREKAAAEARKAQAIKRAESALSEPKPSRRALRKALADLQSLPKGDHEVGRLEQRIRNSLRSWNVR